MLATWLSEAPSARPLAAEAVLPIAPAAFAWTTVFADYDLP